MQDCCEFFCHVNADSTATVFHVGNALPGDVAQHLAEPCLGEPGVFPINTQDITRGDIEPRVPVRFLHIDAFFVAFVDFQPGAVFALERIENAGRNVSVNTDVSMGRFHKPLKVKDATLRGLQHAGDHLQELVR